MTFCPGSDFEKFNHAKYDEIFDAAWKLKPADELAAEAPSWTVLATFAFVLASIAVSLTAALTRGPWIDEFWTLFAIGQGLPLGIAFRERWLTDVHPPLFFFVSREVAGLAGGDIPVLRLQNLTAMAGLIAFLLHAASVWVGARRFLLVYALLGFSSYFATGYFAEYRSYYAQFACALCFCSCGYALLHGDMLPSARERRVAAGVFLVTVVLLVNLHFVTALFTAIGMAGMAALALLRGDRRLAVGICAAACIAGAPLAGTLWIQGPYLLGKAGGNFWIETGPLDALVILGGSIAKGIGLSMVACALAGWTLLRRRQDVPAQDVLIGSGFLLIAAICIGVLLIANLYTPLIVDRYLLLCSVFLICGLAILANAAAFSTRFGFPFLLANAAVFLTIAGGKLIDEPRWNATAALIRAQIADCPATQVRALPFPSPGALANEPAAFALGYAYLGRRYGFGVQMARRGLQTVANDCPTLLWLEHVNWKVPQPSGPDALVLNIVRDSLAPIDLHGASVERTKTGAIVILKPHGDR